jgi:hypothetical protein
MSEIDSDEIYKGWIIRRKSNHRRQVMQDEAGTGATLVSWPRDAYAYIDRMVEGETEPPPVDIGPHIDSVTPDTAVLGAGIIAVDVTGTNFNETCVVEFDQIAQPTTFVSATSLQGSFDASAVGLVEHTYNVTVRDNAIEEESNDVPFTLTAAAKRKRA